YKNREQTEETLLLRGEQVVAPLQRIVQRLLACWQVLIPASQHLKPILEALEQGLGRKQFNASCGQFDGQGQAFETGADGCNGAGIGSGQLEVGPNSLRPLQEEAHRRNLRQLLVRRKLLEIRH